MDAKTLGRLDSFLEPYLTALGRQERRRHGSTYVRGLMLGDSRRTASGIARSCSEDEQALQQFVGQSRWSTKDLLDRLAFDVRGIAPERRAFVIDDTGFPKQGRKSVGVARQYSGTLGKTGNCQIAVSVSLAWDQAAVPLEFELYLPDEWTSDAERLKKAGLPETIEFKEKWKISLDLLDRARARGLEAGVVCADGGYGVVTEFRQELAKRGFAYALGVQKSLSFWLAPRIDILPEPKSGKIGAPRKARLPESLNAESYTLALAPDKWTSVSWREGTKGTMTSRFAVALVEPANIATRTAGKREAEQWLLIEWPTEEPEPTHYWLISKALGPGLLQLVYWAKIRWMIEMNYRELKDELGLDHFEGRSYRGWLCHVVLTLVAFLFLTTERLRKKSEYLLDPP
jgi:SRSO17 transposase